MTTLDSNLFSIFPQPTKKNLIYPSSSPSDLLNLPKRYDPPKRYDAYKARAFSDIVQAQPRPKPSNPEAEAIDQWFENIQKYEQTLEQVAAASLDQDFKDELQHINQWIRSRSDVERTAALYTMVQNASQVQIRFLITVLQQLSSQDPATAGQSSPQRPSHFLRQSHSVIEEDSRKRQFYRQHNPVGTSAVSEPNRQRSFLSHTGALYEKALAAQAQLQAVSSDSSTLSSTSSSLHSDLFARSRLSSLRTDLASPSLLTSRSDLSLKPHVDLFPPSDLSLFTQWPEKQPREEDWTFGSLSKTKKKTWTVREEDPIDALAQAQARLKNDIWADQDLPEEDSDAPPLTGLARRRKRSSQARALKDKIAAETVDFELMKDVQAWLRSLRLHKYGHAFLGLDWKQVIRMTDQDMIDAGVNTIGARRKLLKVFENVQAHCDENSIEY
ncbi:hypothetical protein BY458DRAFT_516231 [Sporodiniella umbellata]|nr:hypothetical protein BY458DRAFT_516231 [Sporodiniella umbellata]